MTKYIERAQLLIEQGRYAEAEKELHQALGQNPDDALVHLLLAICLLNRQDFEGALKSVRQALALDPSQPYGHYLLAKTHLEMGKRANALAAINEAITLNPFEADYFVLKGFIFYDGRDWDKALGAAEQALALAPENVSGLNLRSMCLVKLDRKADAFETLEYALREAPENTYAHATKGWAHIEKGEMDQALASFREALRLNPDNEYARSGLKEAIKGKNFLYRLIQRYFLWSDKMSSQGQWAFIIGIYAIYRLVLWLSREHPSLQPFLAPLIVLYIFFAFSTWIARPFSNLFLRLHPLGKFALDKDELLASNAVGGLLLLALACFGGSFFLVPYDGLLLLAAIYFLSMSIPVSGAFNTPPGSKQRRNLAIFAGVLAGCGFAGVFLGFTNLLSIYGLGILLYGFAANALGR
jgi:tetratricopeptide (TPR) repeat protein